MSLILRQEFDDVLNPFGKNAAEFFLAASLYHAHKISFSAAAALANLGFDEFLYRLREHFDTGFFVADEVVEEDLQTICKQALKEGLLAVGARCSSLPLRDQRTADEILGYDENFK